MTLGVDRALLLVLGASLAAIIGALAIEHVGGYAPCPLCLYQRWPYYAAIAMSALGLFALRGGRAGAAGLLLALCGAALLFNAGLGAYHAGVEWKWWPGPATCAVAAAGADAGGSLIDRMAASRVVPCDEAALRIFGLSLAGWSALICAALAAAAFQPLTRKNSA